MLKRESLQSLGGFDESAEGHMELAFILTLLREMGRKEIHHIAEPLIIAPEPSSFADEPQELAILEKYIIELIFATRNPAEYGLTKEADYIQFGASPRASIHLNLAAKVMAYLEGRDYVLPEDIKEMTPDVLNHRILLTYEAEADNITTLQIIQTILGSVAINR